MSALSRRPDLDFGIHLTLVSDFATQRSPPLAGAERVPSLVEDDGCRPDIFEATLQMAYEHDLAARVWLEPAISSARTAGLPVVDPPSWTTSRSRLNPSRLPCSIAWLSCQSASASGLSIQHRHRRGSSTR